jgi:hypothetical protein
MTIFKLYIVHKVAMYCNPHIYAVLLETEKLVRSLIDQQLNMLCFYENVRKSNCCRHNIFTEGLFVTQVSSNTGTAVWRIAWVATNCCLTLVIFQSPSSRSVFCLADLPGLSHIIEWRWGAASGSWLERFRMWSKGLAFVLGAIYKNRIFQVS